MAAQAAARALMEARKKRKALMEKTQNLQEHSLDLVEQKKIIANLKKQPTTEFLTKLIDGNLHGSLVLV